jgi:hypothetical protein
LPIACVDAAEAFTGEIVSEGEYYLTGERYPVHRFETEVASQAFTGEIAAMSLWAGESVGDVARRQPAAEIVQELVVGAEACPRRRSQMAPAPAQA